MTEFVEENLKTIFAYALSRVSNKEDAEDLVNDIVLSILENADNIKNPDAFYGYIWGIAANTYRKFMHKRNRYLFEEADENLTDNSDFTEKLEIQEEVLVLRREIALLAKEYRECALAYYYDELSCAEIALKFNLSIEMVKYYLFKTRKILKEGISMEREFGEKSFRPSPFEFRTIFTGVFNQEYHNLFARKLPGQILLAAYYTPMTIRELAIELGVASVYLEDEISFLEKYGLITQFAAKRYQTNLIIFTDDFMKEFQRKSADFSITELSRIFEKVRRKLDCVRKLNLFCEQLSDSRILWGLVWFMMRKGKEAFERKYPELHEKKVLYDDTVGTNYGSSISDVDKSYGCDNFAGYAQIDENYYASAADFNILPKRNHYFCSEKQEQSNFKDKLYKVIAGEMKSEFMILSEEEEDKLAVVFADEVAEMGNLYNQMFKCACQIMKMHAPKGLENQVERILFQTLFFQTAGMVGYYLVKGNVLTLPEFKGPAAMYIRENTRKAKASVDINKSVTY